MASSRLVQPQTPASPWAFSVPEFVRGAIIAWAAFVVVASLTHGSILAWDFARASDEQSPLTTLLASIYLAVFSLPWMLPWTVAGLVIGAPIAFGIGRLLRRERRRAVHLLAFATLGFLVGLAFLLLQGWVTGETHPRYPLAILLGGLIASASVAFGWWATMSLSRRRDAAHQDRSGAVMSPVPGSPSSAA